MKMTSSVTHEDVEQVVRRDFPVEQFADVMAILSRVKKDTEEARISFQLNILKLCFGKIESLRCLIPAVSKTVRPADNEFVRQPIPKVTRKHVERIIRRDFPIESFAEVLAVLDEYGKEEFQNEVSRVQLAVLKLAGGKTDLLRQQIKLAKSDYRDVIFWAEYPSYRPDIAQLPAEEQQQIIQNDWQQYLNWANAK